MSIKSSVGQGLTQLCVINWAVSQTFKRKVVIQILALKLINILIPDTVEAYESGELAKLLGIAVEDDDDL